MAQSRNDMILEILENNSDGVEQIAPQPEIPVELQIVCSPERSVKSPPNVPAEQPISNANGLTPTEQPISNANGLTPTEQSSNATGLTSKTFPKSKKRKAKESAFEKIQKQWDTELRAERKRNQDIEMVLREKMKEVENKVLNYNNVNVDKIKYSQIFGRTYE